MVKQKIKYVLILISFGLIPFVNLNAQKDLFLPEINQINDIFIDILKESSDKKRLELNNEIIKIAEEVINNRNSFNYDFTGLNNIVVLNSDDKLLRIYNWNLALQDGTHKYFGYFQYMQDKDKMKVYKLNDMSDFHGEEHRSFTSHHEWFGALYYEIITKKWNRATYYTLIGWDGANLLINRKIIEILTFNRRGLPEFGRKLFVVNNVRTGRMIFEYAERATMMLRYNAKQDIIVMDHLSPPESKYKGLRQYYGPDMSFDSFKFIGGRWLHESDIDPNIAINYKKDSRINQIKRQRETVRER